MSVGQVNVLDPVPDVRGLRTVLLELHCVCRPIAETSLGKIPGECRHEATGSRKNTENTHFGRLLFQRV